ncbi:MAG: N-acetylmuramoyl-L-alanine amidase [Rickettsiaceae bacterium]|jgi:N-acetylmuramoyl-L-alanine amidase|nr:N-acetylmuramoyl-L-alanine amidase [Rickettsiaceae bacterium]
MTHNFEIKQVPSPAFNERIRFLILHYTAQDFPTSLKLLQDKVSVHYLVSDCPVEILQLVDNNKRAWHAGESSWGNRDNLNDTSIGIEIVNLDGNFNPYNEEQIEAVIFLCKKIIKDYQIAPNFVLGHSDIAPLRKLDPGSLFPWQKLYENGIGAMPNEEDVKDFEEKISIPTALELQENLAKYGYKIDLTGEFDEQTKAVLDAFRRHFCPDLIGQEIDKRSYATLLALIKKYI